MPESLRKPYRINAKSIKLGTRCPKAFWYQVNSKRGETDRLHQYFRLAQLQIKKGAMDNFDEGIDLDYNLEATLNALRNTLEPSTFKNCYLEYEGLCIKVEAIVFDGTEWFAYQVKRSLNVKQKHKLEANILTNITQHLLLPDLIFNALYLNKGHSISNNLPLFKSKHITPSQDGINLISLIHPELNKISASPDMPEVAIGQHCGEQGLCPFYKKCFNIDDPSIFTLRQQSSELAIENYQKGITKITDIITEGGLSSFQKIQKASLQNQEVYLAKGALSSFLSKATFPIAFMDFEGYQATIPELEHHHPMSTVPFLFSMHLWKDPESTIKQVVHINHRESKNPEKDFCEALIKACSTANSFVVFNKLFEKDIINRLIQLEPVYADQLNRIKSKLLDFQEVFEKPLIYHPAQNGSMSLKAVSNALLEEKVFDNSWIKNGLQACKGYEYLSFEDDIEIKNEIIQALTTYCSADTYSMYLLWLELTKRLKNNDSSL
ncbi:MAG: hypothetical protein ACI8ZO_000770 [Flavobacteriales bacterium]|jgi:hypothetical protein